MKAVFGLLSLVIVLAAMGLLAKKNLRSAQDGLAQQSQHLPAAQHVPPGSGNVGEQSRQMQQQYRQQLESALNAPRPEPADGQ